MTAPTLPICERLDAWAKVSFSHDRARDLRKAKETIEALVEVVEAVPCECDYDHSCHRCRALTLAREGAPHDKQ